MAADEETAATRHTIDFDGSNQHQVIDAVRESRTRNDQTRLHVPFFGSIFDPSVELQDVIVENIIHIETIVIKNYCDKKNEYIRCFNYFIKIVQESNGEKKHLEFWNFVNEFIYSPEDRVLTNQLADALRNNDNNSNGAIESFLFYDWNFIPVTFQPLWDALLDSGIRKIELGNYETRSNNQNDDIIDFTGLITNASIKELDLHGYKMSKQNHKNLFRAIAANKGIEKLAINFCFRDGDVDVDGYDWEDGLQLCVNKMMRTNISLLGVTFSHWGNWDLKDLQIQVNAQIELNRMWKRYIMRRSEEEKASAATAVTNAGTSTTTTTTTSSEEVDNKNGEEERKKRFKMRMLLHLFNDNKPVLRDTIVFHLLSEYPDDLVGNDGQHQNQILLRSIGSNVSAKNPPKTPYNV